MPAHAVGRTLARAGRNFDFLAIVALPSLLPLQAQKNIHSPSSHTLWATLAIPPSLNESFC